MFRCPTADECIQMATFLFHYGEHDCIENAMQHVIDNAIIRQDYCSDGPGYSGRVGIVMFGGGPNALMVFIDVDGVLKLSSQGYLGEFTV